MHKLTEKMLQNSSNWIFKYSELQYKLLISVNIKYDAYQVFSQTNRTTNTNISTFCLQSYKTRKIAYPRQDNLIHSFQDEEENGGETHR